MLRISKVFKCMVHFQNFLLFLVILVTIVTELPLDIIVVYISKSLGTYYETKISFSHNMYT